jgi:methylenetetrahydrofolate reductase (NADPH)
MSTHRFGRPRKSSYRWNPGRATVSSVAVAADVARRGGRAIACLNARDRNVLGFRRDLLTAAAHGIDHFLCVYGDAPREGRRTEDLTVRGMIDEMRSFGTGPLFHGFPRFRIGTVVKPGRPLAWRTRADFMFAQITFTIERLLEWGPEERSALMLDASLSPDAQHDESHPAGAIGFQ